MDFQRARSEEQREHRRQRILEITADMLAEMPVSAVSLNEISRRVGLAKSNVLRYFESREAILLELLDTETRAWVAELDSTLHTTEGSATERSEQLASAIASTLQGRPVLCDLIAAQAAVLERNVSTEVILRHKHATHGMAEDLTGIVLRVLPELDGADALHVAVTTILITSAAWPHSTPTPALQAAYDADPAIAALHMGFTDIVGSSLTVTLAGLLARHDAPAPR
ncbi:TetR family transcriptional regulator [Leucobacter weissii]|uniref:TetR family transcriptional regulator n=1 Tax=Leucobacter weissii TaxID=1983706 RepID=A0A939MPC0_9MICO|nr:TetR family transcriptional regulator [Leucobacter weissii]MBO1902477.1 TetR family transcriptional regulator [Leucobacter weissii]